jgi:hypothetical protein
MTPKTAPGLSKQHEAVARSMLYVHRLTELGQEFAARNLAPVIVKGQAIVDLAFPKDEVRLSADIDLLVGDDANQTAAALREIGYKENAPHSRHFELGERKFHQSEMRLPSYLELHRCLDKIILRPIPYAEIFARATPSGRRGFRYPAIEDLFLLVVLHASADIAFNPQRVQRDLMFLIDRGKPNMDVVRSRARDWELSRALRRLLSGQHPQNPVVPTKHTASKTATYLLGQLMWHDNPLTVLRGLAKYSLARSKDRLAP